MLTPTPERTAPVSTHVDRDPAKVDLMTLEELSDHLGIPLDVLAISAAMDPAFPRHRIGEDSIARWRVPDCIEWYEGQRNHCRNETRLAGRAEIGLD